MLERNHPARQTRTALGVAGATSYLAMLWVISDASESSTTIDLAASLGNASQTTAATGQGLDLTGGATPVPPAPVPQGAEVTVDPTAATAPVESAPAETAAPTAAPTSAPVETTAATVAPSSSEVATTAPPSSSDTAAPSEPPASDTAPTTVAPTTAPPTTQPPQTTTPPRPTTTVSSGS